MPKFRSDPFELSEGMGAVARWRWTHSLEEHHEDNQDCEQFVLVKFGLSKKKETKEK